MKSIDYLKELTKFEHRGSATKNERQAAEYILQELKRMGYKAEKRTFKTTRDNLYMLPLQVGVLLFICGFFSLMYGGPLEIAAFLHSLFAISLLLLEVSGKPVETSIMPRHLSQNVFTSFDESRSKRIIVSAHYDTQKGSIMFHPKIVDKLSAIYNISYIGFGLIPIGILFNIFNLVIASAILRIGLIIVFANIIFMAICEVTGRYTQGANDNGTGVALTLALANYYINHKDKFPDNVDMVFLFTGSEETGERGMKNFIREYRKKLSKETKFIILDNLGTGKVTYLEGEGMIFYKRAGKMLLDIAEEMAKGRDGKVQKMKNLLLPTDALPAMDAGFDAIAFLAKDEKGRLGNYHWHTDTIENVDTQLLSYEEEFFKEYLVKVAERLN
ncbi:Zn-dependent amino-or carboxypeptidase, M28 family [Thermoanaerobacter thermohydrosulfuricus]|uniref:Zn-dependent amino-or carboxypeptidase, M28 family n=1 Tax=Thermoanaerobacter thermohydrosulfuricus TaxID=1516 RepID=A0A1G7WI78_THETY|nr:M28 family peptidase [Thermoanaerobacter thermohydrosulfuricus]SDG70900.1 Zn-dependent amino-or carboxypeptidase, M28 family [Thermoanaerobacter thermohydrosulfuricus]